MNKYFKSINPLTLLFNIKGLPLEVLITQILRKGSLVLPGGKVMQFFLVYVLHYLLKKILKRFKVNPSDSLFNVAKNGIVILSPKVRKLFSKNQGL